MEKLLKLIENFSKSDVNNNKNIYLPTNPTPPLTCWKI
jgi:hypothetical protein